MAARERKGETRVGGWEGGLAGIASEDIILQTTRALTYLVDHGVSGNKMVLCACVTNLCHWCERLNFFFLFKKSFILQVRVLGVGADGPAFKATKQLRFACACLKHAVTMAPIHQAYTMFFLLKDII